MSFLIVLSEFKIWLSVIVSTALNESSKIRIGEFLINALAIEILCFCPPDTVTPRSPNTVS